MIHCLFKISPSLILQPISKLHGMMWYVFQMWLHVAAVIARNRLGYVQKLQVYVTIHVLHN